MALTEIPVELSSTPGIADSSNATAITIDSSERVLIGADSGDAFNADSMLRIGRTGDRAFLQFKTDTDQDSGILFGNTSDDVHHQIVYSASNDTISIKGQSNTHIQMDAAGHVTMPLQPAFSAYTNSANTNIPTDASSVTVNFGAEYYDQNSDYNTSTYTFTAPVTGKYQLMTNLYVQDADDAAQYIRIRIATSNRNYDQLYDPRVFDTDPTRYNFHSSVLADMDASDTAVIQISQYEGTAQMDVAASVVNNFSGYLVA